MPPGTRSLGISRAVRNRRTEGNRVVYEVDPPVGRRSSAAAGADAPECAIAERVVLLRWKRRESDRRRFVGGRLPPSTWRALPVALGKPVAQWRRLSVDEIRDALNGARNALKTAGRNGKPLRAPSADVVHALIEVLGAARLKQLVARHASPERHESPGVPDLFLYAVNGEGRVESPRFVEVKKPEETVRPSQHEEIDFLRSLGLEAQLLRLEEGGHVKRTARRGVRRSE